MNKNSLIYYIYAKLYLSKGFFFFLLTFFILTSFFFFSLLFFFFTTYYDPITGEILDPAQQMYTEVYLAQNREKLLQEIQMLRETIRIILAIGTEISNLSFRANITWYVGGDSDRFERARQLLATEVSRWSEIERLIDQLLAGSISHDVDSLMQICEVLRIKQDFYVFIIKKMLNVSPMEPFKHIMPNVDPTLPNIDYNEFLK